MIGKPQSVMACCVQILDSLNASPVAPPESNPPDEYVRCSRVGGGMSNAVTDTARILIECWARTNERAEQLANEARYLLLSSTGSTHAGVFVRWCREVSGPVDFPDVTGPRYQFVVELLAATR